MAQVTALTPREEALVLDLFGDRVESIQGVATCGEDVVIVLDLERTLSPSR